MLWVATGHEAVEAGFELPALQEDVAPAALAAQPDVGAEAIHEPLGGAARMGAPKADHVAQVQLEHRPG